MILRAWRGWPAPGRAEAYERLLNGTIAPAILRREIDGLSELAVLRRLDRGPAEYLTLMTFDDWPAVGRFAGPDPGGSVVPAEARELLDRYDARSRHYELVHRHLPGADRA